jgi:hypothetical protein
MFFFSIEIYTELSSKLFDKEKKKDKGKEKVKREKKRKRREEEKNKREKKKFKKKVKKKKDYRNCTIISISRDTHDFQLDINRGLLPEIEFFPFFYFLI